VPRVNPYGLAKAAFWALPGPLRERLHGVRHQLVRLWRTRLASLSSATSADMAWADFCAEVLDCRDPSVIVLVFEPTIDWGVTLFQRPQHMAMALGRRGCIVLYRTTGDGVGGVRAIAPNVWLVGTPEITALEGAVWCVYSTASLSSPAQMAGHRQHGRVVYEYIDHIDAAISGSQAEVQRLLALKTAACSGQADYLVASARVLYEELSALAPDKAVAYIANGVDVGHFRDGRDRAAALPERFVGFRGRYRTLVGYFGAVAPWLWFDMMSQLAGQMPEFGFVYIGPDYGGCAGKLPRSPNVLYMGAVDYNVLPAYAGQFDVCFIPFSPGTIARSTSPLKLYEYFALEKPVVVTAEMQECTAFAEVFSGADLPTLMSAIGAAAHAGETPSYREAVLKLANLNTWDLRAEAYLEVLRQ